VPVSRDAAAGTSGKALEVVGEIDLGAHLVALSRRVRTSADDEHTNGVIVVLTCGFARLA
jgi:hypothetical protein